LKRNEENQLELTSDNFFPAKVIARKTDLTSVSLDLYTITERFQDRRIHRAVCLMLECSTVQAQCAHCGGAVGSNESVGAEVTACRKLTFG